MINILTCFLTVEGFLGLAPVAPGMQASPIYEKELMICAKRKYLAN